MTADVTVVGTQCHVTLPSPASGSLQRGHLQHHLLCVHRETQRRGLRVPPRLLGKPEGTLAVRGNLIIHVLLSLGGFLEELVPMVDLAEDSLLSASPQTPQKWDKDPGQCLGLGSRSATPPGTWNRSSICSWMCQSPPGPPLLAGPPETTWEPGLSRDGHGLWEDQDAGSTLETFPATDTGEKNISED